MRRRDQQQNDQDVLLSRSGGDVSLAVVKVVMKRGDGEGEVVVVMIGVTPLPGGPMSHPPMQYPKYFDSNPAHTEAR